MIYPLILCAVLGCTKAAAPAETQDAPKGDVPEVALAQDASAVDAAFDVSAVSAADIASPATAP